MVATQKATTDTALRRRVLFGAVISLASTSVPHEAGAVHPEGTFRRAGNLVVYLGVVPAAVVRGHPPEHAGKGMHGGAPEGRYVHHLLVAVFEETTGARVTDAAVAATIRGRRHSPETRIALEPMALDGTTIYGGFATLPPRDYYRLTVEVRRPGATAVRATFPHRHFQP
ncbi:hypothetical protein [Roseicella aerolata]|uniref:DUF4426 domain-containing protein n=1 Tax=Roseicella aerolata TaxID=2883479 RepID=A0A9X1IHC2_9PROT|nr:hypothetical protein [Roseicella aerolata]MCB4824477.1 hypothetical protein [Roseicella aerolata]